MFQPNVATTLAHGLKPSSLQRADDLIGVQHW
jgi:hypothetical protein